MLQVVKMSQIWNTAQNTEEKREKIRAFSLAKECYYRDQLGEEKQEEETGGITTNHIF
ncbi:MAG: hypothetical protein ACJ705_00940 [Nitrososphaeraceae archaeon]